jgi:hypothetical protein
MLIIKLLRNMSYKMDLQEVGWGSMNWIDLAQDRDRWRALVNVVMYLPVPYVGKFVTN